MSNQFHTKDLSKSNFLITGGAGFIGSHIAEYLLQNKAKKVRVLDNLANGKQSNLDVLRQYNAFEFIEGDIRNVETCQQACSEMDYVSHQAALGSVPRSIKEPVYFNEVNVGGFVNMLKASVDNNIKQFVYASSSSVYGDEPTLPKIESRIGNCLSPYAATKKTNELYAQIFADVYGIKLMGFRYFNIFGPRQDPDGAYAAVIPLFVKNIMKQLPVYINGDGEQTRDFTFIHNAVQANILALTVDNPKAYNQAYNVAFGQRFTINQMYDSIRTYLGRTINAIHRETREGDIRDSLADISKAQNLLGYIPKYTFKQGLPVTIEYFKKVFEKG